MAPVKAIKNMVIGRVLNKSLEGFTGSNILGVIILGVIHENINYMDAFEGLMQDRPRREGD